MDLVAAGSAAMVVSAVPDLAPVVGVDLVGAARWVHGGALLATGALVGMVSHYCAKRRAD